MCLKACILLFPVSVGYIHNSHRVVSNNSKLYLVPSIICTSQPGVYRLRYRPIMTKVAIQRLSYGEQSVPGVFRRMSEATAWLITVPWRCAVSLVVLFTEVRSVFVVQLLSAIVKLRKVPVELLIKRHLRATECQLPHGITRCAVLNTSRLNRR